MTAAPDEPAGTAANARRDRREKETLRSFLLRFPYGVIGVAPDDTVAFFNAPARSLFGRRQLVLGGPLPTPVNGAELGATIERVRRTGAVSPPRTLQADQRTLRVVVMPPAVDDETLLVVDDVTRQMRRDRVYGEFVRNAAHHLRTPTAAIASAVEVLQSGAKDRPADRDHFLAHIERETARLKRLTQALLVLARTQAGIQPPRLEFIELEPLLAEVVAGLAPGADGRVDVACDPDLAVFAERDLAEQAFVAIIENAVRHDRSGRIRIRGWESASGMVTVEIADGGAGILPEHVDRITEPFYRGSVGGDGFGLGLAIAAQALAAVGGSLRVESVPRRGTNALVDLPSARVTARL